MRRADSTLDELLLIANASAAIEDGSWFVYLFALTDCSAFKVGFSCNPLQRIATFSRRYFERFDLSQSVIVELQTCECARELEARVKGTLGSVREPAPAWVPGDAGGHTEWFSAVYFMDAESLVRGDGGGRTGSAFDFFRPTLARVRDSFERWAFLEAQRLDEERAAIERGYTVRARSGALRDWLDAYTHFDIPLFADDAVVASYVRRSARASHFPLP
jgi:hypothetical protein